MFVSSNRSRIRELLQQGLSAAEIARRTGLAYSTVSYHRERITAHDAPPPESREQQPPEEFLVPVNTREEVHRLLSAGSSRADVARHLGISKSTVTYHARRLGRPIDERAARRYDWQVIQRHYDAGHTVEQCRARYGFSRASWSDAVRRGDIKPRPRAMPIDVLLSAARNRANLKRRLVGAGLLETICGRCGLRDWQGMPISLQLHHLNGMRSDHRLENLALLCPNCHSQTDTYSGRNGWRGRPASQPSA
jgi:DNA-binding CsgD family transcriptional regulator